MGRGMTIGNMDILHSGINFPRFNNSRNFFLGIFWTVSFANYSSRVLIHSLTVLTSLANNFQINSVAASVCSLLKPAVASVSIVTW
jgi:hypothetical protein